MQNREKSWESIKFYDLENRFSRKVIQNACKFNRYQKIS